MQGLWRFQTVLGLSGREGQPASSDGSFPDLKEQKKLKVRHCWVNVYTPSICKALV